MRSSGTANSSIHSFRNVPWAYLGPVLGAPIPHVFVSLINRYPQHKTKMLNAVVWTSIMAVATRLVLMYDAGYPASESPKMIESAAKQRELSTNVRL
jgi:hypothetical protein